MSKKLEKYKDDFFLLLEGGFIAVKNADEDSAIKLFRACEILNPESTFPRVGLGYMHLCKLELKQASSIFNEVLQKEPNNDMAKTFLGIVMSMNPSEMAKGEKILTETAMKSSDPELKKLSNTALDFVDQHLKKAPSPAEIQKPAKKSAPKKKPRA